MQPRPHLDVHPVDGTQHIAAHDATGSSWPPGAHSCHVPHAVVVANELHSHTALFRLAFCYQCFSRPPRRRQHVARQRLELVLDPASSKASDKSMPLSGVALAAARAAAACLPFAPLQLGGHRAHRTRGGRDARAGGAIICVVAARQTLAAARHGRDGAVPGQDE